MRTSIRNPIALALAAALAGCAGGGGHTDEINGRPAILCAALAYLPCLLGPPSTASSPTPSTFVPSVLTNWSDQQGETVTASGPQVALTYEVDLSTSGYPLRPTSEPVFSDSATVKTYTLYEFETGQTELHYGNPVDGRPGMSLMHEYGGTYTTVSTFWEASAEHPYYASTVGLMANQYELGWNYQSFGVWNRAISNLTIGANSYGVTAPSGSVPTTGAANFVGKLGAMYISPSGQGAMATADLGVSVDFSRRSLSFASSGTLAGSADNPPAGVQNQGRSAAEYPGRR